MRSVDIQKGNIMEHPVKSIKNSQHFSWGEKCDGWFLAQNPNVVVIQETMLPHTSEKKHYHEKTWQFIYVLEGTLTMEIGDQTLTIQPFEGIEMPPPIPHNFHNRTDLNIIYLLIGVPNLSNDRINL